MTETSVIQNDEIDSPETPTVSYTVTPNPINIKVEETIEVHIEGDVEQVIARSSNELVMNVNRVDGKIIEVGGLSVGKGNLIITGKKGGYNDLETTVAFNIQNKDVPVEEPDFDETQDYDGKAKYVWIHVVAKLLYSGTNFKEPDNVVGIVRYENNMEISKDSNFEKTKQLLIEDTITNLMANYSTVNKFLVSINCGDNLIIKNITREG